MNTIPSTQQCRQRTNPCVAGAGLYNLFCDGPADCPNGEICCLGEFGSSCEPPSSCTGQEMCAAGDSNCSTGGLCGLDARTQYGVCGTGPG